MKTIEFTDEELQRLIAMVQVSVDTCELKIIRLVDRDPNDEAVERYKNILAVKESIMVKLLN